MKQIRHALVLIKCYLFYINILYNKLFDNVNIVIKLTS